MSVISFEKKRIKISKQNKAQDSEVKRSELNEKNIVHMGRFLKLKQNALWENIKLRNGLVVKIHNIRKCVVNTLKENHKDEDVQSVIEEVMELASTCSDLILYSELSTIELLNKYWEFKKSAEEKVVNALSL
ncbi:MAG: hypothetical protein QNJ31_04245 [Candidatus Caenarcaniphilales bacterium]|nr:hypothetical protein [Candidatus Caenarcaniphilales bacterium]